MRKMLLCMLPVVLGGLVVFSNLIFPGAQTVLAQESVNEADIDPQEEANGDGINPQDMKEKILGEFDYEDVDKVLENIFPKERIGFRDAVSKIIDGEQEFSAEMLWQMTIGQLTGVRRK